MIGAMMSASFRPCPCFGFSKCSLRMRKLMNSYSNLGTCFLDDEWYARMIRIFFRNQQQQKMRKVIVNEVGGQYEEVFNDIKSELRNCFTAKAVRTVLYQLYEMNPPQYMWLHNFIAENDPADGKPFLRTLAKESQDIAERVMITRLHLYGKWIKQCDHAEIYKEISDENLELMRERLLETIVWPMDDKIAE